MYLLSIAICKMGFNLAACKSKFLHASNNSTYTYNGPIRGILGHVKPRPPLITVQGCKDLCGEGSDYYPWIDVSSTITTWVRFLSHQVQSAVYTDDKNRYCRSSASSFRHHSRAMRTSKVSWRLRAGWATLWRAYPTSFGTYKSPVNAL